MSDFQIKKCIQWFHVFTKFDENLTEAATCRECANMYI